MTHSLRRFSFVALMSTVLCTQPLSWAQGEPTPLRVGAVLSLTGADAATGRAQEAALRAWEKSAQAQSLPIEITVADDRGNPLETAARAADLVKSGAHALLCCETAEALTRVSPVAREAGVLTLAFNPPTDPLRHGWLFSLAPDAETQLEAVAAREQGDTLALLGLEGDIEGAARIVRAANIQLAAETRYPLGAATLTPEALWVITRQPSAVLVWGRSQDTPLAVEALSERGFEGRVYINPQVYADASPLSRADLRGVLTVADAVSVGRTLPSTHPTYRETRRFISALSATYGANEPTAAGGYTWDAMTLLQRAFEAVLTYDPEAPADLTAMRQALRDSLVGLGPVTGAAAIYDYLETDHIGIAPRSLVIARIEQGKLTAAR